MNTICRRLVLATLAIALAPGAIARGQNEEADRPKSFRLQIGSPKAGVHLEIDGANDLSTAFQRAAKQVRPSVVSIHAKRRIPPQRRDQRQPFPEFPDDFREFFGDDFFRRYFREGTQGEGYLQRGFGTGVIVSEDGYVVTNSHVIRGAGEIQIRLEDGRELEATLVGSDDRSEIAVVHIDANDLKPAVFGDSDALKVGQWVLAIGNPFHLTQTVTAGIVSARGRSNVGITDYEDFIQTDAAINPGNSGGPLINLKGEVVGINTAIASRTGGYMGIGFAIPSNMIQRVMDQLIEHGRVERGLLGVVIQSLTPELAKSFDYSDRHGVLVSDVPPDGPAAKAGMRSGDIIQQLNGRPVTSANELRNSIAESRPGTVVRLDYYRGGNSYSVELTLAALGENGSSPQSEPVPEEDLQLGMKLRNATPEIMSRLGRDPDQKGVVVTEVRSGEPADDAGVRMGDVIIAVDGEVVTSEEAFHGAIAQSEGEPGVRIQLLRNGTRTYVFLKRPTAGDRISLRRSP